MISLVAGWTSDFCLAIPLQLLWAFRFFRISTLRLRDHGVNCFWLVFTSSFMQIMQMLRQCASIDIRWCLLLKRCWLAISQLGDTSSLMDPTLNYCVSQFAWMAERMRQCVMLVVLKYNKCIAEIPGQHAEGFVLGPGSVLWGGGRAVLHHRPGSLDYRQRWPKRGTYGSTWLTLGRRRRPFC